MIITEENVIVRYKFSSRVLKMSKSWARAPPGVVRQHGILKGAGMGK